MQVNIPFSDRLSTRLAMYVIVIAVTLGLLFSAIQIYLDYFLVQNKFAKNTLQVLKSLEKPATHSVNNA